MEDEKITKIQLTAAQNVLNLQVKVDETRLKRRKLDILPKLLDIISEERNKLIEVNP